MEAAHHRRLILHWGLTKGSNRQWFILSHAPLPLNTMRYGENALQTEFVSNKGAHKKTIQIRLSIDKEKEQIEGMSFVLYSPEESKWYNNNSQNYQLLFNANKATVSADDNALDIPSEIIKCESQAKSWTLMHRYNKCNEIIASLSSPLSPSEAKYIFMKDENSDHYLCLFIWIKLAHDKQFDWQRNFNTRPRHSALSMNQLVNELVVRYIELKSSEKYYLQTGNSSVCIKMILSLIGKGEGNGRLLRNRLLEIIHKYNIKQTHDRFYSEWYQQLQNNNSHDDVTICQALINYLRSGKIESYRNTLKEGGITKEMLENRDRPITLEPKYKPQYLNDFEQFLPLLKSIHSMSDIVFLYESVKGLFGPIRVIEEIIAQQTTMKTTTVKALARLVRCRRIINRLIGDNICSMTKVRDLLYLDNSLEPLLVQSLNQSKFVDQNDLCDYIEEISLILTSISITYPKYARLLFAHNAWAIITSKITKHNAMTLDKRILIKLDETCRVLNKMLDEMSSLFTNSIDKTVQHLGRECNLNKEYYISFSESQLSNSILFHLSIRLNKLEVLIRKQLPIHDWINLHKGNVSRLKGRIVKVNSFKEAQNHTYKGSVIIITSSIEEKDEIPHNCIGIFVLNSSDGSYPHILSPISIQAKKKNLFFAICFDSNQMASILSNTEQDAEVKFLFNKVDSCPIRKAPKVIHNIKPKADHRNDRKVNVWLKLENDTCSQPKTFQVQKHISSTQIHGVDIYSFMRCSLSIHCNESLLKQLNDHLSLQSDGLHTEEEIVKLCQPIIKDIDIPFDNILTQRVIRELNAFSFSDNEIAESMTVVRSVWASNLSLLKLQSLPLSHCPSLK